MNGWLIPVFGLPFQAPCALTCPKKSGFAIAGYKGSFDWQAVIRTELQASGCFSVKMLGGD